MKNNYQFLSGFLVGIALVALGGVLVAGADHAYSWSPPSDVPPHENVDPPINVSQFPQSKTGGFGSLGAISALSGFHAGDEDGEAYLMTGNPFEQSLFGDTTFGLHLNAMGHMYVDQDAGSLVINRSSQASGSPIIFAHQDNEQMRITSDGMVGVGATNPSSNLSVAANDTNTNGTPGLTVGPTGTEGPDALSRIELYQGDRSAVLLADNEKYGFYGFDGEDGWSEALTVDYDREVYVGESMRVNTGSIVDNLRMVVNGNVGASAYCDQDGENCLDPSAEAGEGFWTQSNNNLYPNDLNWNVGIGTDDPSNILDVETDTGGSDGIRIRNRSSSGWANLTASNDQHDYISLTKSGSGRSPVALQNDGVIFNKSGDLKIFNIADDGDFDVNTPAMTIRGDDNNNYVGIGTADPAAKLDVAGQLRIRGGNPADGNVLMSDGDGLASWQEVEFNGNGEGYWTQSGSNLYPDNLNWNVGLGTSDPGAKLDVDGQIRIRGGNPADGNVLMSDGDGLASWQELEFDENGTDVDMYTRSQTFSISGAGGGGSVSCDGGDWATGGSITRNDYSKYQAHYEAVPSGDRTWSCSVQANNPTNVPDNITCIVRCLSVD